MHSVGVSHCTGRPGVHSRAHSVAIAANTSQRDTRTEPSNVEYLHATRPLLTLIASSHQRVCLTGWKVGRCAVSETSREIGVRSWPDHRLQVLCLVCPVFLSLPHDFSTGGDEDLKWRRLLRLRLDSRTGELRQTTRRHTRHPDNTMPSACSATDRLFSIFNTK